MFLRIYYYILIIYYSVDFMIFLHNNNQVDYLLEVLNPFIYFNQ